MFFLVSCCYYNVVLDDCSVWNVGDDAGGAGSWVSMVSLLYRIRRSPTRNTVKIRESSDRSSWWKAVFKSSLLNIDFPVNMGMMSSTLGIGRLVSCSALLRFLRSNVTLMEPSAFGTNTGLDNHVTGPWCGSMTSSASILWIASSNVSFKWYGTGLGGCITGDALGFICSWMGSAFIFPKPWNTDGCCVMMRAMGGVTDFVCSVASSVDAVLVLIELMRLPFISIVGVLKVILPSGSAGLHDTKLMGFSRISSTTIHVDLHFLFLQYVCVVNSPLGVISLLPYGWSWMCVFVRRLILSGTWLSRIYISFRACVNHGTDLASFKCDVGEIWFFVVVCVSFTVVAPMTVNVEISLWCVRHTEEKWFFLPQMPQNLPRARHVGPQSHFGSPQPKHRFWMLFLAAEIVWFFVGCVRGISPLFADY